MPDYTPALHVSESDDRVRLSLSGLTTGEGSTLQDAGDDLVRRTLVMAMAARAGELDWSRGLRPEPGLLEFLWRLGHFAAAGGDVRELIFGTSTS